MQMHLVMSMRLIFSDDWNDVPCKSLFDLCFSGIEALEFSWIYTRIACDRRHTVFLVVANMHTKSIQKKIKSIDLNKVGSKKPLVSKFSLV